MTITNGRTSKNVRTSTRIAIVAGLIAAFAVSSASADRRRGHGNKGDRLAKMTEALDLSAEQVTAIEGFSQTRRATAAPLKKELRNQRRLVRALRDDGAAEAEIEAARDEMKQIKSELRAVTKEFRAQVDEVLTDDQLAKRDELRANRKARRGGKGKRGCKGKRGKGKRGKGKRGGRHHRGDNGPDDSRGDTSD